MTPDNVYRVRKAISDLYAHTQITEALAALRMLDVGETTPA